MGLPKYHIQTEIKGGNGGAWEISGHYQSLESPSLVSEGEERKVQSTKQTNKQKTTIISSGKILGKIHPGKGRRSLNGHDGKNSLLQHIIYDCQTAGQKSS